MSDRPKNGEKRENSEGEKKKPFSIDGPIPAYGLQKVKSLRELFFPSSPPETRTTPASSDAQRGSSTDQERRKKTFQNDFTNVPPRKYEIQRFNTHLPDGREVTVVGNPDAFRKFNHLQGNNSRRYNGTCGIVACEDILRQFGKENSEQKLLAYAIEENLCDENGGTNIFQRATILRVHGIPARAQLFGTLEKLAQHIEHGQGVIIAVDASKLWHTGPEDRALNVAKPDHAVVVTGIAYESNTEKIVGFYINDSGTNKSGQFIDADTMRVAWQYRCGLHTITMSSYNQ